MKVEMVMISNIGLWSSVFGSLSGLWFAWSEAKDLRPKDHHQILMFRIFLTISIPVTCRKSAATIK